MTGITVAGLVVTKNPKPTRSHPPGKLPASVCRRYRQIALKALAVAGFTAPQISQILGTPERTIRRDISKRGKKADQIQDQGGADEAPEKVYRADAAQADGPSRLTAAEIRDIRTMYADSDCPSVKAFLDFLGEQEEATGEE